LNFAKPTAELWIPDNTPDVEALSRCTHVAIVAHQDDIEIMAMEGVLECYRNPDKWLLGLVVTDGSSSARTGPYANYTNDEMKAVRRTEQKQAAFLGEFGAQGFLDYTSAEIKDAADARARQDIAALIAATKPKVVYTHNLADKHPTHIGVALRTIEAIRSLPVGKRPAKLLGCEVWRDLDWMMDDDKVVMRLDSRENLQMAMVGVFDSQIAGGKRYDLATMGRRRAHATYHDSHAVDASSLINFAMDLTPVIQDDMLNISDYVLAHVERFAASVRDTIAQIQ
jgi:LmbE family N-acetylglucosaminyl deacetylase